MYSVTTGSSTKRAVSSNCRANLGPQLNLSLLRDEIGENTCNPSINFAIPYVLYVLVFSSSKKGRRKRHDQDHEERGKA